MSEQFRQNLEGVEVLPAPTTQEQSGEGVLDNEEVENIQENQESNLEEEKDNAFLNNLRLKKRVVDEKGAFSVNGIRYALPNGSQYEGNEVIILHDNLAGIIKRDGSSGAPQLTHFFDLFDRDDPRLSIYIDNRGRKRRSTSVDLIKITPYDPEEFSKRQPGEEEKEYQERLGMVQTKEIESILRYSEENERQLENLQVEMFALLKENGLMEELPDGTIIIEIDSLVKNLSTYFSNKKNLFQKYKRFGSTTFYSVMQYCFADKLVVSRDDYERAQKDQTPLHLKSLLYKPKDQEAAFSEASIKKSDFYISVLDFKGAIKMKSALQTTQDGESVNLADSAIALLIYHPKYGNGYRDKDGQLMVWWESKKEFRKISVDWFRKEVQKNFFGEKNGVNLGTNARLFMDIMGQELEKTGVLRKDDFKMLATSTDAEKYRTQRKVGKIGSVTLEGIQYYIGKGEKFKEAEAVVLSPGLGGVLVEDKLSGRKKLAYTFPLLELSDPRLKLATTSRNGNNTYRASKESVQLRPYNAKELHLAHADENPDSYERRIKSIEDTDYLLALSNRLSREAGINLSKLSLEEQSVVVDAIKGLHRDPERIINFAKKYGLEGLRTFISCEYGDEYGERILTIAEKAKPELVESIFKEYSEINNQVHDLGARLAIIFGQDETGFINQFQEALTRRLKDIINTVYQIATEGRAEALFYGRQIETKDQAEPVEALRDVRRMVQVISSFLSSNKTEQELFKFLEPIIDESVVAHTPNGVSSEKGLWTCYRFQVDPIPGVNKQPSQLMVQLRKYGAPVRVHTGEVTSLHNPRIEFDGEARINFVWIVDPVDPAGVYINITTPERSRAISLRLDREGKVRDADGNLIKEKNDPTRAQGELSLEMGAVPMPNNSAINENTGIGKNIAIGQYYSSQHDAREHGHRPQYYHNRASFSPEFGQADFFAKLVERMATYVQEKYIK